MSSWRFSQRPKKFKAFHLIFILAIVKFYDRQIVEHFCFAKDLARSTQRAPDLHRIAEERRNMELDDIFSVSFFPPKFFWNHFCQIFIQKKLLRQSFHVIFSEKIFQNIPTKFLVDIYFEPSFHTTYISDGEFNFSGTKTCFCVGFLPILEPSGCSEKKPIGILKFHHAIGRKNTYVKCRFICTRENFDPLSVNK